MPNLINANGLQTKTRQEIIDDLVAGYQSIYGANINVDSDSPDGQLINIYAQVILDNLELIRQVYNSFDPDQAIGVVQDQRYSLNGIQRQGGTFSQTEVDITTTGPLTLYGKNQSVEAIYTVEDDEGNQFELLETEVISSAGTYSLLFQAVEPGQVLTTPDTITSAVTIVLGVSAINNPDPQTLIGIDEETDFRFRIRRQQSVSLASQGYRESLIAELRNITGITSAFVYENNSPATDSDGVPSHSIWVIVAGIYDNEDVASAIYQKRNAGAGMFGDNEYVLTRADGTPFLIKWDDVETVALFIKFEVEPIDGVSQIDYDGIRDGLPEVFIPGVFESVNTNTLATFVQGIDANCLITNDGFSTTVDGAYTELLAPSAKKNQFVVTSPNIIILPILVLPGDTTVDTEESIQFEAKGGFGAYAWTLETDASGASIGASTGLYTAGTTPGTDTIRATDDEGNFTDVDITVV